MDETSNARGPTRRQLLGAGAAAGLALTSGCLRRVRNVVRRSPDHQLSVSISTVEAEEDPVAARIATIVEDALTVAGIDVEITTYSRPELYRTILFYHDYDLFVDRQFVGTDPDFLYEANYSGFAEEWGRQNPYGLTNISLDERLDESRAHAGTDREMAVADVLTSIADEQPFTPICRPIDGRVVDPLRFDGWGEHAPDDPLAYLSLSPRGSVTELTAVTTDDRPTRNLNPLAVEYRDRGLVTGLLYDSLAVRDGDELVPWLAADWEWNERTVTVDLRSATWHDGEPVTAHDVAFTYTFLEDTTLEDAELETPAPIYRGRSSAIESVEVIGDDRLELSTNVGEGAVENALTVPILPEHVWVDRTDEVATSEFEITDGITEAIATDNVPPIGGGPFEFAAIESETSLELVRYEGHFSEAEPGLPTNEIDRFYLEYVEDTAGLVDAVVDDADVGLSPVDPRTVDGTDLPEGIDLVETTTAGMYYLGFNTRITPLGNPRFRQTIAALIDKAYVVETAFDGRAEPIVSPLGSRWTPESLEWDGEDPVTPFLGTDGELDEAAVRDQFEEMGYRYDEDGTLLVRN